MWPRKRLDIGWSDFALGLRQVAVSRTRPPDESVVGADWIPADKVLVSLSVRTGWDLLLAALHLPAGSEVIMSAVTIPDMVRIVAHHGLVPMPVDVDAARLEPAYEDLERAVSPRTRAILVAHLFGSRVDMAPIIQLAQQHNLLMIEDCAQAFVGRDYAGHPATDVSLFSFGPIKTATALGGAILRVRDPGLLKHLAELQRDYPVQSRRAYLNRLLKYAAFCSLSAPSVYGALVRTCRVLHVDFDRAFGNATHSFGRSGFFQLIRQQPCVPLVRMLQRRIARFDRLGAQQLRRRIARGVRLARVLSPEMVPGARNPSHSFWVLPLRVDNRDAVLAALRRAGFDATGRSSLIVVPAPNGTRDHEPGLAPWLGETIFSPNGDDMPDDEFERMLSVLCQAVGDAEPSHRSELSARPRVSLSP